MRQWRWFLAIGVLTATMSATAALQPWPMKLLVDYALGDEGTPELLASVLTGLGFAPSTSNLVMVAAVASLGLFVINSALSVGLSLCWSIGGQRMVFDLSAALFARLQRLSLLFHKRGSVGDLLNRLTGDTHCINSLSD